MNDNPIFEEFDKGDLTDAIFEEVYFGDIFYNRSIDLEDIQTAIDLNNRPIFLEGVVARLNALGVSCSISDEQIIAEEVKKRYKDFIGEPCPRTILEWIKGTPPSTTNRANNYNLCFALDMNLHQTAEFFLKHFLTVPFNYKDRTDAIYFYALTHKKPYSTIKRLLEAPCSEESHNSSQIHTSQIGRQIIEMESDEEFLQYLSLHSYSNEQQYQLARAEIVELIDINSEGDFAKFHDSLMGFNYQFEKRQHKSINKEFPSLYIKSLPTDGVLKNIYDGKKESYETIRKTLIILKLYDFYNGIYQDDEADIRSALDDFYDEVNATLMRCGLAHLYMRHPFDWIIIFCALSSDPLTTFQELNAKRYID